MQKLHVQGNLKVTGNITGDITGNAATATIVTSLNGLSSIGSGNIITDSERTKLTGIESNADVTDAANVLSAGAVMTSGNQTIGGAKTFENIVKIKGDSGTLILEDDNSTGHSYIEYKLQLVQEKRI